MSTQQISQVCCVYTVRYVAKYADYNLRNFKLSSPPPPPPTTITTV
jgi:hypothetical protein